MEKDSSELPLAVDMDGTLILSDMSVLSVRRVLTRRPWLIPSFLIKEITGKKSGVEKGLG